LLLKRKEKIIFIEVTIWNILYRGEVVMNIIKNIKEQKEKDKQEFYNKLESTKEYAKESFSAEHREKVLEDNINRMTSVEMKEISKTQYTTHIKLFIIGILVLMFGFVFPPLFLLAVIFEFSSLVCMIVNRKKIKEDHYKRKNIK
jgi:hypothetical protein